MKKIAIMLSAGLACAATPAFAQSTGISPRIEIKAGYNELRANSRLNDSNDIEQGGQGEIGFGIEAGVDANISERALVGVYAGYDFPRINDCDTLFEDDDEACFRNKRNLTVGLRGGLRLDEGGVIFVKGGYSNTKLRLSYNDGDDDIFNESDSTSGWHVGAGFEVPVTGGFYIKGEYVYTRYKNVLQDLLEDTDRIDPHRHQIMGGIGFRFGASQ